MVMMKSENTTPMNNRILTLGLFLFMLLGLLPLPATAQDGVAWDELPDDLQGILGPMQPQWDNLPPLRQERLRNGARRWQSLTPDQQSQVQEQFRGWTQRSPEQREMIRNRFERFQEMNPDRQRAMRNRFERFRNLPPERQEELRRRFDEVQNRREAAGEGRDAGRDARILNQNQRPGTIERPPNRQAPVRQQQTRPTRPAPGR